MALPPEVATRFCIYSIPALDDRIYRKKEGTTGKNDRSYFVISITPSRITLARRKWETRHLQFLHHWYFYQFFRLEVLAMLSPTWIGKAGAQKIK
jgi:hypothetical protein